MDAEKLIARILFLEGGPTVSKLDQINIGSELGALGLYNGLIAPFSRLLL